VGTERGEGGGTSTVCVCCDISIQHNTGCSSKEPGREGAEGRGWGNAPQRGPDSSFVVGLIANQRMGAVWRKTGARILIRFSRSPKLSMWLTFGGNIQLLAKDLRNKGVPVQLHGR